MRNILKLAENFRILATSLNVRAVCPITLITLIESKNLHHNPTTIKSLCSINTDSPTVKSPFNSFNSPTLLQPHTRQPHTRQTHTRHPHNRQPHTRQTHQHISLPKYFTILSAQIDAKLDPQLDFNLFVDLYTFGFKVKRVTGMYNGVSELSYLVEHDGTSISKRKLVELGQKYDQEYVIHYGAGETLLINCKTHVSKVGCGVVVLHNSSNINNFVLYEHSKLHFKFDV